MFSLSSIIGPLIKVAAFTICRTALHFTVDFSLFPAPELWKWCCFSTFWPLRLFGLCMFVWCVFWFWPPPVFFYKFKHLLDWNLFLSPFLLLLLLLLCLHMGPKSSVTPREFPGAAVTVLKVTAAPSVLRAADPCRLHSHLMETSSVRLVMQSHVPVCCWPWKF